MTLLWQKFLLLTWKNYKLQIRHPLQLVFQILLPFLFCALLLLVRGLVDPEYQPEGRIYPSFDPFLNRTVLNYSHQIYWSPCNVHLKKIMNGVVGNLDTSPFPILHDCVNSAITLENKLKTDVIRSFCGVQFDDNIKETDPLPNNISMKFRFPGECRANSVGFLTSWLTDRTFPGFAISGPRNPDLTDGAVPNYNQEGFLVLQKGISLGLIDYFKSREKPGEEFKPPKILLSRLPFPPWIDDMLLPALKVFTGLMLVSSFLICATSTVKALTDEKEIQIKEAMKIMGLPNWLHWTSWFIKSFVIFFVACLLVIGIFKIKYPNPEFAVLSLSNVGVLIIFMILYCCASITLCFAISVFFNKANTAAAVGGLIWFLLYFPYSITSPNYDMLSLSEKMLLCLASNSALPLAFDIIYSFEGEGEGMQWSNIWSKTTPENELTLGHIMVMLFVDTIVYLLIALYVEAIYPGEFGTPKPWYFPFTKTFWFGESRYTGVADYYENYEQNPQNFEKEPKNLPIGIQIKHLGKIYSNKKTAVRDFNLNMYREQITVLLGHNGAGKTTTMSMLTGMFPPTSGTAMINGYDIVKSMDKVRDSLGLCPQYNIIFKELTVEEHLYFFGKLKGLNSKEIKDEIDRYISLLELEPKRNTQASKLSGGMKRKLCIGISLCGKSKVVLLDEPTAGVDPSARRVVWNLLQKEKKGRTILLSTHFMDEADLLGDRIAIMADGTLQVCGSSFFLKKRFGTGYSLVMEKNERCRVENVTEILRKYIPNIVVKNVVGSEVIYLLTEDNSNVFENMLSELESKSESLGIESYGISLSTLEEVFLKLGADKGQATSPDYNLDGDRPNNSETALNLDDSHYITGFKLLLNQIYAMFYKRALSTYRSWLLHLIQILIPVLFIVLTMVVAANMKFGQDLPNLDIKITHYENPITLVGGPNNSYKNAFVKILSSNSDIVDVQEKDYITQALQEAKKEIASYRRNYIIGASFTDDSITAWFNNIPYHTPPLALGTVMNSILKTELGSENYSIHVSNHPLPYNLETKILNTGGSVGMQLAVNIGLSMAFVSSFFILFFVRERVTGAKHLQYVSGARVGTLWLVSYVWDFLIFFAVNLVLIITLVSYQEDGYKTFEDIGRVFLCLTLFSVAVLPLIYLASFMFQIPASGYTYVSTFSVFAGIILFTVVTILGDKQLDLEDTAKKLHLAFLVFPQYTISSALQNLNLVYSSYKLCNTITDACLALNQTANTCDRLICTAFPQCCDISLDYFAWDSPGIGKHTLYFILVAIALMVIFFLKEYGFFKFISYSLSDCLFRSKQAGDDSVEDTDVLEERDKIREKSEKELAEYALAMRDVTKYYKKFLAVNKVCLGINKYDCFGLLGVNGAGKTTTFKMMTGDERISSGNAWVCGMNLKTDMKNVYKIIGYCPQFDALLDNLTGRETLIMFSLLRGIKLDESRYIAERLSRDFDFHRHIDKKIKEYSGGNKRKLSTALAFVGDPQIIYLDEPTTGMDPATKRLIWDNVNKARDSGKCVILTSHSMEECEALCTKIAIMVNGQFKCLGSTQHLKNKFSQGYTLTIKLKEEVDDSEYDLKPIETYVQNNFPTAQMKEQYQKLITYYIPDSTLPWSKMFGVMEKGKQSLKIEDYSLGQCSLEQVFLTFTKYQNE